MIINLLKTVAERSPRLKQGLRGVRNRGLQARFAIERSFSKSEFTRFTCNICSREANAPLATVKRRELPSCYNCGSQKRFRTVAAVLSLELFGVVIPISKFTSSPAITGLGMSDSDVYARPLSRIFDYQNTYYHKEPKLDILSLNPEMEGRADFVISSDVFEHVPQPLAKAFENLFRLLKPGGLCVFSVPFKNDGVTQEHYPDLHQFEIINRSGKRVLVNRTKAGVEQVFENLKFHGGPGSTLELRMFSKAALLDHFSQAGFIDIKIHDKCLPEFGILLEDDESSLIVSMRRP